ncbi:kinase-like protein [Clavulina sp. PMI_390]|nr:kinase-like protein [Clavulina sp. PMI_390]
MSLPNSPFASYEPYRGVASTILPGTSSSTIGSPSSSLSPPRSFRNHPSNRHLLIASLSLSKDAVKLDTGGQKYLQAAVNAYFGSILLLRELMNRLLWREATSGASQTPSHLSTIAEELKRLNSIHEVYSERLEFLCDMYNIQVSVHALFCHPHHLVEELDAPMDEPQLRSYDIDTPPFNSDTNRAPQPGSDSPLSELPLGVSPSICRSVGQLIRRRMPGEDDKSRQTKDTILDEETHSQSAQERCSRRIGHINPLDTTPQASPLADLGAEIRKIDQMPIIRGGFCDIYRGERLGKQQVALRILRSYGAPRQLRQQSIAEAQIWAELRHPNILEFQGICDYGTSMSMVSPWLPNGNVVHYLASVAPTANRYKLLYDASQGLLYLHSLPNPIVHGDIKSANILVQNDGTACLADFGLSRFHEDVTVSSLRGMGSQRYMAPELFEGWENEALPMKNMASDCYALGQVVLELASGVRPFAEIPNEHIIYSAVSRGYRPKRPENDVAKTWLTDHVWKLVQSKQPSLTVERSQPLKQTVQICLGNWSHSMSHQK